MVWLFLHKREREWRHPKPWCLQQTLYKLTKDHRFCFSTEVRKYRQNRVIVFWNQRTV